jgi:hypothetical protein
MQAVNLAADIADRIRANRRAGVAYKGAGTDNKCAGAAAAICSKEEMAANDVFLWKNQIKNTFPGGGASGSIDFVDSGSSTAPSTYTIKVTWKEQGQATGENESTQSYELKIQSPTN